MTLQRLINNNRQLSNKFENSRRQFLRVGMGACALMALPPALSHAQAEILNMPERKLSFLNLHTGERIQSTYWIEGQYVSEALQAIQNVLRDHRTGDIHAIDPDLLNLLQLLRGQMGTKQEFHVISAYRSPKTNAMLSARSNGVATKSLHMQGMAIDIRLPGHDLTDLQQVALSMEAGGVGYYPRSDFLHIDTGRVRSWGG
tara:strand:- start:1251 stop:1853 length:603 start_codon:yes stop_codon:yes gene_type:complete